MVKTVTETKLDFMPYWKKEEQCFEDAKVEGKASRTGKKATNSWPRDIPQGQMQYLEWLKSRIQTQMSSITSVTKMEIS